MSGDGVVEQTTGSVLTSSVAGSTWADDCLEKETATPRPSNDRNLRVLFEILPNRRPN